MNTKQQAAIDAAIAKFHETSIDHIWNTQKSVAIIDTALENVKDRKGNKVDFAPHERAAARSTVTPTIEGRGATWQLLFEKRDIEPDPALLGLLKQFMNPAAVEKTLKTAAAQEGVSLKGLVTSRASSPVGPATAQPATTENIPVVATP